MVKVWVFLLVICSAIFAGGPGVGISRNSSLKTDVDSNLHLKTLLSMDSKKDQLAYIRTLDHTVRRQVFRALNKELRTRSEGKSGIQINHGQRVVALPYDRVTFSSAKLPGGSIVYDNGSWTQALSVTSEDTGYFGNRFNTHTGIPVPVGGTVSTVSMVLVKGASFISNLYSGVFLGAQTTMGQASMIQTFSGTLAGSPTSTVVTLNGLNYQYTGSSFHIALAEWSSIYVPVAGPGTTMGQGQHAVECLWGGGFFNVIPNSGLNAFIRVQGNVVPVELMKFDVQ